ncbi:MAG: aldehyde dehydrogenase family protein [Phycisphaerales bacterium]|nr:aldehyde dehydrogenase family protein [Phycisphaerales bacterium]
MTDRADITKTWKLFIGGAYPRSESGRVAPVTDIGAGAGGKALAYIAQASRKDLRDAVEAARGAQEKWAASSGYLRGQIIYRLAELLDARREELVESVRMSGRLGKGRARGEVEQAIDRTLSFAGWCDKLDSVLGGRNPVAGPFHCFSQIEPSGVVAVVAPQEASLLGFLSLTLPAIACGCAVIAVASEKEPIPALVVAECAPSSDIPPGVLNVLTGMRAELVPVIAGHRDIDAVVASLDPELAKIAQIGVSENLKRVRLIDPIERFTDDTIWSSPRSFQSVTEVKTVWHTVGS